MTPLQQLIALEKKARSFGMDWPDLQTIIDAAVSECGEIRDALNAKEPSDRIQEEIGDLLHTTVSLCLFAGFDLDETLAVIVKKFGARMAAVEAIARERGLPSLQGLSFEALMTIWKEAKERTLQQPETKEKA